MEERKRELERHSRSSSSRGRSSSARHDSGWSWVLLGSLFANFLFGVLLLCFLLTDEEEEAKELAKAKLKNARHRHSAVGGDKKKKQLTKRAAREESPHVPQLLVIASSEFPGILLMPMLRDDPIALLMTPVCVDFVILISDCCLS